nr:hypothetical protein CFP56_57614 [Quercus suber]
MALALNHEATGGVCSAVYPVRVMTCRRIRGESGLTGLFGLRFVSLGLGTGLLNFFASKQDDITSIKTSYIDLWFNDLNTLCFPGTLESSVLPRAKECLN